MVSGLPLADRTDRFVPTQPPPDDACAIVLETLPCCPAFFSEAHMVVRATHACLSRRLRFLICATHVMPRGLSACIVDICREKHPGP